MRYLAITTEHKTPLKKQIKISIKRHKYMSIRENSLIDQTESYQQQRSARSFKLSILIAILIEYRRRIKQLLQLIAYINGDGSWGIGKEETRNPKGTQKKERGRCRAESQSQYFLSLPHSLRMKLPHAKDRRETLSFLCLTLCV